LAYQNAVIPAAVADADRIVKEAEAEKESRINAATGQTARFNEMFEEYVLNKEITQTRMYLETLESVLPGVSLYVDGGGDMLRFLNLNPGHANTPAANTAPARTTDSGTEGE